MARKIDNKIGMRRDVITIMAVANCLPRDAIALLNRTVKHNKRKLAIMEKEGVITRISDRDRKSKESLHVHCLNINDASIKACREVVSDEMIKEIKESGDRYKIMSPQTEMGTRLRISRCAEVFIFYYSLGYAYEIGAKNGLQKSDLQDNKIYFTSRQVKNIGTEDAFEAGITKDAVLANTRVSGLIITPGGSYPIYYTDKYVLTVSMIGEIKLREYVNNKLAIKDRLLIKSAILFYKNEKAIKEYIYPEKENTKKNIRELVKSYEDIYLIPMNTDGKKIMRIMEISNWERRLKDICMSEEIEDAAKNMVQCDGYDSETYGYMLIHCMPDLKRLKMFITSARADTTDNKYTIICYDIQKGYINELVKNIGNITVKIVRAEAAYQMITEAY